MKVFFFNVFLALDVLQNYNAVSQNTFILWIIDIINLFRKKEGVIFWEKCTLSVKTFLLFAEKTRELADKIMNPLNKCEF